MKDTLIVKDNSAIDQASRAHFKNGKQIHLVHRGEHKVALRSYHRDDVEAGDSGYCQIYVSPEEFIKITGKVLLSSVGRSDYIGCNGDVVAIDKVLELISEGEEIVSIYLIDKIAFDEEQEKMLELALEDLNNGIKNGSYPVTSPMTPIYVDITRDQIKQAYCCSLCGSVVVDEGGGDDICPQHNTREHFFNVYKIIEGKK